MKYRAPLLELSDLPDDDLDLAIGVEDGPGGRLRVLERRRGSIRSAVPTAAHIAEKEAAKTRGALASKTPAALRSQPDSDRVEMEFDVVEDGPNRPRSRAHQVRVVVMAKKGSPSRPRTR